MDRARTRSRSAARAGSTPTPDDDADVDEAGAETFPASDPPSWWSGPDDPRRER